MNSLEMGKLLAKKEYSRIINRGKMWQMRNIPAFIRANLMTPFYFTTTENGVQMHIIQYPSTNQKVHFVMHELNAEEITKVLIST